MYGSGTTDANHASIERQLLERGFDLARTSVWHRFVFLTAESDWASREGLLREAREALGDAAPADDDMVRMFLAMARVQTECMPRGGLPETMGSAGAAPLPSQVAAACVMLCDMAVQGTPLSLWMEQGHIWCGFASLNVLTMTHLKETNLVSRATGRDLFGISWSDEDFEQLLSLQGGSARQGAALRQKAFDFVSEVKHWGVSVHGIARHIVN